MKKIVKVILIITVLNFIFINKNFSDGLGNMKNLGQELVAISALYEIEFENGNVSREKLVVGLKDVGFKVAESSDYIIEGKMANGKFFAFINKENTKGKIRVTVDSISQYYEVINKLESINGINMQKKDMNLKYSLKESIEKTAEKILIKTKEAKRDYEVTEFNRGKEIIISNKSRILKDEIRMGNLILVEYGDSNYIIFGEKEIFMDY